MFIHGKAERKKRLSSVAVTLARPLHVNKVGQSKEQWRF